MIYRNLYFLSGFLLLSGIGFITARRLRKKYLPVVNYVDLSRYMGTWYEIARMPARFEKDCYNSRTEYSFDKNGTIVVANFCNLGSLYGKEEAVRGRAFVADPLTNAKLKIRFQWPFKGDYWILAIDPEYQYAMVGEPSRKYLWILSRKPDLPAQTLTNLITKAQRFGFEVARLIFTRHKENY